MLNYMYFATVHLFDPQKLSVALSILTAFLPAESPVMLDAYDHLRAEAVIINPAAAR